MQRISSKFCTVASCAVILSALSACSTGAKDNGLINSGSDALSLKSRAAQLDARERAIAAKEANLSVVPASSRISSLTPPNAKPGQCFTKIFTPAKYRTVTEKQLVEEAGQKIEVIPASYKNATKRVLVSEATEQLQVVPATYKTVTERVLVKAASSRLEQIPATYETVTSRIMEHRPYPAYRSRHWRYHVFGRSTSYLQKRIKARIEDCCNYSHSQDPCSV